MTVAGSYEDLLADLLEAVAQVVDDNKTALGLNYVRVGNQLRGWTPPAAFVFLGAEGAPESGQSRARGVWPHDVHVDIVVVGKPDPTQTRDLEVLRILGKIPALLKAAMPITRSRHFRITNPGQVGGQYVEGSGKRMFETQGRLAMVFGVEAETGRP